MQRKKIFVLLSSSGIVLEAYETEEAVKKARTEACNKHQAIFGYQECDLITTEKETVCQK